MRRSIAVCAAGLLSITLVAPGDVHAQAASRSTADDTPQVCVMRDRQVRLEPATVDPAARATVPAAGAYRLVYSPAALPHADSTVWFDRWPLFTFRGLRYARFGLLLSIPPEEVKRVGEYDGIPLYALKEDVSPAGIGMVLVPIAPGCQYQGYYYFHNPVPVRDEPDPPPSPVRGGIVDRADDMLTNEADRTTVRLDGFRRHFIPRYQRRHGKLPARIDDFMPPPGSEIVDYRVDGWGRAFRYRNLGKDYDLRSAGPDGRFDTEDDIQVTRGRGIDCQSPLQMSEGCEN